MADETKTRGNYALAGERVSGPYSDEETKHIVRTTKYIAVGSPELVTNWCLSHFNDPNPSRVLKCSTFRHLEEARINVSFRGAEIILVPGWARKTELPVDMIGMVLAGVDGVGI